MRGWGGGGQGGSGGGWWRKSDGMEEKVNFISFPSYDFLLVLCATVHKQLVSTVVHSPNSIRRTYFSSLHHQCIVLLLFQWQLSAVQTEGVKEKQG